MLKCYLVDKPSETLEKISRLWRADLNPQRQSLGFSPFGLGALLIAAPGLALLFRDRCPAGLIGPLVLLLVCSALPSLMFYAAELTMMGTFASLSLLIYVITAMLAHRALSGVISG